MLIGFLVQYIFGTYLAKISAETPRKGINTKKTFNQITFGL